MKVTNCLACGSDNLVPVRKFPDMPLTDAYLKSKVDSLNQHKFPLGLSSCPSCGHLQLDYLVNPEESYSDYLYQSNITPGLSSSFNDYARHLKDSSKNSQLSVLDVGSNDGSFLNSCRLNGLNAYGVEPNSQLASAANQHGLATLQTFFDTHISEKLVATSFPVVYDFITFNNVFANLPDPKSALIQAKSLLNTQGGSIVIQTGYHPEQFGYNLFDYVYHEHYSYFSLSSISALAQSAGLTITDFQFLTLRGGSLRVFLTPTVANHLSRDHSFEKYLLPEELITFFNNMFSAGASLKELLIKKKSLGQSIVGFGSSHSTGVMVHSFGLAPILDFLVDENSLKHNRYMPGTDLEVKPLTALKNDAVIVVLAHQYFKPIELKLRKLSFDGEIINPMLN